MTKGAAGHSEIPAPNSSSSVWGLGGLGAGFGSSAGFSSCRRRVGGAAGRLCRAGGDVGFTPRLVLPFWGLDGVVAGLVSALPVGVTAGFTSGLAAGLGGCFAGV